MILVAVDRKGLIGIEEDVGGFDMSNVEQNSKSAMQMELL